MAHIAITWLPECSLRSCSLRLCTLGCHQCKNFVDLTQKLRKLWVITVVTKKKKKKEKSAPKSPVISLFDRTYLNSSETIWTQETFTLCGDVCPAPFEQVDDGGPAVPGVGVVLGEGKPEQSHQNEQLHDFFAHLGVSFRCH